MPKKTLDATAAFQEGQLLFIEKKIKESIEAFTNALEAGSDPFMTYLSRGSAYLQMKETDYAINDFSKAIEANKKSARPYYYRGMAYMVKSDYGKAADDLSKALELAPKLLAARFARAVAYARSGKLDEASSDLKDTIPEMEAGLERFADNYGIVKTEMWKVMSQLTGEAAEAEAPGLELTPEEVETIKKWLVEG